MLCKPRTSFQVVKTTLLASVVHAATIFFTTMHKYLHRLMIAFRLRTAFRLRNTLNHDWMMRFVSSFTHDWMSKHPYTLENWISFPSADHYRMMEILWRVHGLKLIFSGQNCNLNCKREVLDVWKRLKSDGISVWWHYTYVVQYLPKLPMKLCGKGTHAPAHYGFMMYDLVYMYL